MGSDSEIEREKQTKKIKRKKRPKRKVYRLFKSEAGKEFKTKSRTDIVSFCDT